MMYFVRNINYVYRALLNCYNLSGVKVRRLLVIAVLLGGLGALTEYSLAFVLQEFFVHLGLLSFQAGQKFRLSDNFTQALIFLLIVGTIRSITDGSKIYVSRMAQQVFSYDVRNRIMNIVLNSERPVSSSKTLSFFSDEVSRAGVFVLNCSTFIIQTTIACILFAFAVKVSWLASLFGFFLLGLCYLPIARLDSRLSNAGALLTEEWEKTNSVLVEGIRNHFYIKVSGLSTKEVDRANRASFRYLSIFSEAFKFISVKSALPSLLGLLILSAISYLHYHKSFFGAEFQLFSFFYIFLRFTQALAQAAAVSGEFKINSQSSFNLKDWLETNGKDLIHDRVETREILKPSVVKFEHVSFSYDKSTLLKDVNLELRSGDCLVITGRSGSGKSTLLSLLMGFDHPQSGRVLINGSERSSKSFTEVSYVGPYPYLVEGTLKENLLYGNPQTDLDVWPSLDIAQLSDFIKSLPLGLETRMDEVGSTLSVGQKQRLMIARALLRNANVIIMDEATSNLDDHTEREFISKLRDHIKDKILIIATHRKGLLVLATHRLELTQG